MTSVEIDYPSRWAIYRSTLRAREVKEDERAQWSYFRSEMVAVYAAAYVFANEAS